MVTIGRARSGLVALACIVASQLPLAAQLVPTSNEFQVNTHTTSTQFQPALGTDAAGNFLIVWNSYYEDADSGIVERRFDSLGTAQGTEFQVNSYTTGAQYDAEIGVGADGRFVVVWTSYDQDGSAPGVFAQRFDASSTPVGSEFQVNTTTAGEQRSPAVDLDTAGNFMIAWTGADDGSYSGVFARCFDSSGVAQGSEFLVNTFTGNDQFTPDIAHTGAGFIVVWSSFAGDLSSGAVYGQRFDAAGAAQGTEFQLNTYTTGPQGEARVAADANGNFVTVWSSTTGQDGNGFGIFGQRYTSAAVPIGTEFQVNSYTTGDQARPDVAAAAPGNFVVTWEGPGPDEDVTGMWARAFTSDGIPDGDDLHVNQFTAGIQYRPRVASTGDRSFVVTWTSQNQDGDLGGIFARRFIQAGTPITGRKLYLRTSTAHPDSNKLTFISTDPALELPQESAEDPRCQPIGSGSVTSGARLRVVGDGGNFSIELPCTNWTANSDGTRFRYRDASGATCRSIVLRAGRLLKASCKGAQVAYALGAAQSNVNVVLATGDPATNHKYCATFGAATAATIVHDGSDGRRYSAADAGLGACP